MNKHTMRDASSGKISGAVHDKKDRTVFNRVERRKESLWQKRRSALLLL